MPNPEIFGLPVDKPGGTDYEQNCKMKAPITPWRSSKLIEPQRVGFVSTRFAGTDGVSLEAAKWAEVLAGDQHQCFWYAGRLDRPDDVSFCVPEANLSHPENVWINDQLWGKTVRSALASQRIMDLAGYLKETLHQFVAQYELGMLIIENASSIPMHVPLGAAIAEFLVERPLPVIGHHHDFYWERSRYNIHAASDYLEMAFPPRHARLQHVVINQAAQEELSWRKGVTSVLVPNVLNFAMPPPGPDPYASDIRAELGLAPDDIFILQPTRVVPRKGIEHAITLAERLENPRCKLVISHEAGDEGLAYRNMLVEWAHSAGVDLRFVETRVGDVRQFDNHGKKIYTLWDLYPHADLVTYPSLYEGFGNAFLEAIYFKKPVVVNRYAIFGRDIEPKGFRAPIIEGFVTTAIVQEVQRILEDATYRREMVEHNYQVASRFYDYSELRRCLRMLIINFTGQ